MNDPKNTVMDADGNITSCDIMNGTATWALTTGKGSAGSTITVKPGFNDFVSMNPTPR